MNRELIIIIVCIGMVLFFYLIQDKSASPQPAATLGDKSPGTAIIQDIVKQGGQTEVQLKQNLEKAFTTSSDSL